LLKAQHWFRPMEHLKPLSSTLAGARTESLGKLKEEQLKVGPNGRSIGDDATHRASQIDQIVHEWGATPLENSIVGIIRVPSGNSWFGYQRLGCLTRWIDGGDGLPRNGGQCRHGGTPMTHWLC